MKKWKFILAAGVVILGCAGCGSKETEETGAVEAVPVDEVRTESESDESEAAETENETQGNDGVKAETDSAEDESLVEEKNENFSDLEEKAEDGDVAMFAGRIQEAVSAKDMEALADLCAYPLAVNGEAVDSREAFMALGADTVFTEERCAVIEAVDVSALEETMAGVIMGDATPNIIFKSVDGTLGITGIN